MTSENSIRALLARARTKEARRGIRPADELSDLILFHIKVCGNSKKIEQPMDE